MFHKQPSAMICLSRFVCWRVENGWNACENVVKHCENVKDSHLGGNFFFSIINHYPGILIADWFPKTDCLQWENRLVSLICLSVNRRVRSLMGKGWVVTVILRISLISWFTWVHREKGYGSWGLHSEAAIYKLSPVPWDIHWGFPMAAVTIYHKLGGLKRHSFILQF